MKLRPLAEIKEEYEWASKERFAVVCNNNYIVATFCFSRDAEFFVQEYNATYINNKYEVMKVIEE